MWRSRQLLAAWSPFAVWWDKNVMLWFTVSLRHRSQHRAFELCSVCFDEDCTHRGTEVTTCSLVVTASSENTGVEGRAHGPRGNDSAYKAKILAPMARVQRAVPLCSPAEGILERVLVAMTWWNGPKVFSELLTETQNGRSPRVPPGQKGQGKDKVSRWQEEPCAQDFPRRVPGRSE